MALFPNVPYRALVIDTIIAVLLSGVQCCEDFSYADLVARGWSIDAQVLEARLANLENQVHGIQGQLNAQMNAIQGMLGQLVNQAN